MRAEDEAGRAADEAMFREANERIRATQRELRPSGERLPILCECEEPSCCEPILLSTEEYELVRADSTCFVVVSGHPTDGEVLAERDGHLVVRKTGRAGDVAAETDPRKEDA